MLLGVTKETSCVITGVFYSTQIWGSLSPKMEPDGPRHRRPQGEAFHRAGGCVVQALLP
jgi:hypothetical protein